MHLQLRKAELHVKKEHLVEDCIPARQSQRRANMANLQYIFHTLAGRGTFNLQKKILKVEVEVEVEVEGMRRSPP